MNSGTLVAGIVLLVLGFLLTATIIGAIIGIPLLLIGFILLIVGAVSSDSKPAVVYAPPPPAYYPHPAPGYLPAPPSPYPMASPVTVQVHQAAAVPPPPQIMRRCRYCGTVFPEASLKCPSCGAAF